MVWHAGKLETFAEHARIVHIDVDPAEINKNKEAHIPMFTSSQPALAALNDMLQQHSMPAGTPRHLTVQMPILIALNPALHLPQLPGYEQMH